MSASTSRRASHASPDPSPSPSPSPNPTPNPNPSPTTNQEGLFAGGGDERTFDWPVHRGHAHHGVFVVPPHGVTVGE